MLIKYKHKDKFGITGITEVEGRLFVTKDKNGKDVFAGDKVQFQWMGKTTKAKIVKDDLFNRLVSCEGEVRGLPRTLCKSDRWHIELIKEKEDE